MMKDYFRCSPRIRAAKIRKQAQHGESAPQVRVVEGYYDLDTDKVEWSAK